MGRLHAAGLIIEGHTNWQINKALIARGLLDEGEELSAPTMTRLRKMKEAQIDYSLISLEAKQVAHVRYSNMIVDSVEANKACMDALLGKDRSKGYEMLVKDPAMYIASMKMYAVTSRIINEALAWAQSEHSSGVRSNCSGGDTHDVAAQVEAKLIKELFGAFTQPTSQLL